MTIRDESTEAGRKLWAAVDRAAARAPKWIKRRVKNMWRCGCRALNRQSRVKCHKCGQGKADGQG